MPSTHDELIVLRTSMYRLAETLGIRPRLNFVDICRKANHEDRGWNSLAAEIQSKILELQANQMRPRRVLEMPDGTKQGFGPVQKSL